MKLKTLNQKRANGELTKADFTLKAIRQRVQQEVDPYIKLLLPSYLPFPKDPSRWLSHYQYFPPSQDEFLSPKLLKDPIGLTTKLLDFSFLRYLLADTYSKEGGLCYDPVSLFLLRTFASMDGYTRISPFVSDLNDPEKGHKYLKLSGVNPHNIPCQMTFTNFEQRINQLSHKNPHLRKFEEIIQTLDIIFHKVGLITCRILSTDGNLFPSFARYKGCTYHQGNSCLNIQTTGIFTRIKQSVSAVLAQYPLIKLGKTYQIHIECPLPNFPQNDPKGNPLKKPKICVFEYRFFLEDGTPPDLQDPTLRMLGIHNKLCEYGLSFHYKTSHINQISFDDKGKDQLSFCCPKLPKDLDARFGVKKDNHNPNKKEFVFGYNQVTTVSIEPELKTAFPVWLSTQAGNPDEGKEYSNHIDSLKAIPLLHCQPKAHIADSKSDELQNYHKDRSIGIIPFIALNDRNDDLSPQGLKKRGYDRLGRPFAHCGIIANHFQGFDSQRQRLSFACGKHCHNTPQAQNCSSQLNPLGHLCHLYLPDNPRIFNEVPRGSKRFNEIYSMRNLSENFNSTEDFFLQQLQNPIIYNLSQAQTETFFTFCATLFVKVAAAVSNCSLAFKSHLHNDSTKNRIRGRPPNQKPNPLTLRPLSPALKSILS